ncbi:MAG: FAD-binding oxidoreductase [Rhodospirillaceae bacterium]|nr:FAD-binding oxidoreductase [Rhodospirillaceae bacterium]MBT6909886.1 FAD-binding oxidoreductase [Rhodospirillaceae bacterium]MBT6983787.1 FAD-binding oxidoreductase [Rhodospirillaceae bacterium]MBT7284904.1 FAD-binding oxidoreductase [Rhodospirillaceae bacterium]
MVARKPKFCGWGYEGDGLTPDEHEMVLQRYADHFDVAGFEQLIEPPTPDQVNLHNARVEPPAKLSGFCSTADMDRLSHTYGKSFPDYVRIYAKDFTNAPDIVAYAKSEDDIDAVLDWATGANIAVIPFGGGSSVVGGVEPAVGGAFAGTLSLDLTGLDQILEIDKTSRAARMQGGIRCPDIEDGLRPQGLTMRHFPQSFDLATLGGMIATRSGGHYATVYTHIDDFVESTRMMTPAGTMESRRLPGSGAGPSPDRMAIGSEGSLGIITEAWVRLQDRPSHRRSTAINFDKFEHAVEAVRQLTQSGLFPTNVRLLDRREALLNGAGNGEHDVVVLGFESADHPVDPWMDRGLAIARELGGAYDEDASKAEDSNTSGAAGAWRNAFIKMPHFRDALISAAVIDDTFETAITWDQLHGFLENVSAATEQAIRDVTGRPGIVSCRFTHAYPDGAAPYFSFKAKGRHGALLEQWTEIKKRSADAVIAHGGTITHHHAVGRDHMPWYTQQRPEVFGLALQGAKDKLDPAGILNPGVIVPLSN